MTYNDTLYELMYFEKMMDKTLFNRVLSFYLDNEYQLRDWTWFNYTSKDEFELRSNKESNAELALQFNTNSKMLLTYIYCTEEYTPKIVREGNFLGYEMNVTGGLKKLKTTDKFLWWHDIP